MDIVRFAITKPVTVTVGVILLVMFGLIGLGAIPVQLTPTVDRPVVQIQTTWPGRSPEEIVDEITKEQEERLKNVPNLKSMRSITTEGSASITLEFYIGSSMSRALQEVSDRLRQVPDLPPDATEPTIQAAEGSAENAIAWIIVDLDPAVIKQYPDFDITTLFDPLDKEVKPFLERTDGVAQVNVYGGRPLEMRVLLNPESLADRQLSHLDVIAALRAENRNISAGTIAQGKRDIRVRVLGQYTSAREILDTVVTYRDGKPVFVHDVGTVQLDHAKQRGFVRSFGYPSIAINVIRQSGANVMEVMHGTAERDGIVQRLDTVRTEILPNLDPRVGKHLRMRQVYDETVYIASAIDLVKQNLWVGGLIAAGVLLIFLRSFVSTGVIALAIPISVIGTFLVMLALGRTLNVISLAGIAFAVGMVVDNAIVVLENIFRRIEQGESARAAALTGGREVWGAILASTLTTIAVFVPILTIQEEAGQLFRDLALAIVAAVTLSLIVSITVIPAACSRWLHPAPASGRLAVVTRPLRNLLGLVPLLTMVNRALSSMIYWLCEGWRGWTLRPALIALMTLASLAGAVALMPPMDYLPAGNRNLVFGGLLIPPGYSIEQRTDIARRIEAAVKPYSEADQSKPSSLANLPPITRFPGPDGVMPAPFEPVGVENFFIGAFGTGMFVGATSQDPQVVLPIGQLLTNAMISIPDSFGGAQQSSLFGQGVGGGNTIDIEISGPDLERVTAAAGMAMGLAGPRYSFGNVRPDPANFNLKQQEIRVRLNNAGRLLGLRTQDIGTAVRALFDGVFVDDFRYGRDAIDLLVLPTGGRLARKEQIAAIPIVTPRGIVPIDSVVDITPALAPQEIQRIEELPAVTLRITPPTGRPLEEVMTEIRNEIIGPVRAAGLIDPTMRVRLQGTAAKLDEVRHALLGKPNAPDSPRAPWQRTLGQIAWVIVGVGGLMGVGILVLAVKRKTLALAYGSVGIVALGAILAGVIMLVATQPQLGVARFVWAVVVTYLLMAALFESFLYPLVIMFSVPLAIVGGFAGLRIVHEQTLADPTIAPQQLDVLTMIGFVILVGVVVNNAILLVHQALNLMRPSEGQEPLEPHRAIAESVRTRVRPIFMSVLTSIGGMLPLVLFPGAGSEMYRGLGSVVVGGLLVSTVFTLLLVPLLFALVLDMRAGVRAALRRDTPAAE